MRFSSNKGKSSTVGGRIASGVVGSIIGSVVSSNKDIFEEEEKKEKQMERQSFYDQKDEDLVNMDIPETEKELIDFMDYLISIVGLHGWSMSQQDEPKRKNALSDAAMAKIEMGLFKLNRLASPYYPFYHKKFKAFKRKRVVKTYVTWLIIAVIWLVITMVALNLE